MCIGEKKKPRKTNKNLIMVQPIIKGLILITIRQASEHPNSVAGYILPLVYLILVDIDIKSEYSGNLNVFVE